MATARSSAPTGLQHVRVLIVEDEPFIALDMLLAVEEAGGEPVGPATSIREALELINADGIQAAILDVNLPDGHIGPVLEALGPTVAIVVHTGVGLPADVHARFSHIPVFPKPTSPTTLTNRLVHSIKR